MRPGPANHPGRSVMDRYDKVVSYEELYKALRKTRRGVMWKDSVSGYNLDGLKNTLKLREELLDGTYEISPYQVFTIHESKEREIVATRIRDRQFQRSLCDNILYEDITRGFIHDNCACLKGRGVDYALNRMDAHLHRYYRKHGCRGWVLRCDIRHYFPDTPHETAKAALRKRVKDQRALAMAERIVDSFGGDRGIGLGSQVSQLIELAVLDDLDHYIKERLRIRHYIRYMDDMILVHESREALENALREIKTRITALGLELNHKTQIAPLRQGIRFLQWRFILTRTGKVIRRMSRRSIVRERRRMKRLAAKAAAGRAPWQYVWQNFQSWRANARRGNTRSVERKMTGLYTKLRGVYEYDQRNRNNESAESCRESRGRCGAVREVGRAAGAATG